MQCEETSAPTMNDHNFLFSYSDPAPTADSSVMLAEIKVTLVIDNIIKHNKSRI